MYLDLIIAAYGGYTSMKLKNKRYIAALTYLCAAVYLVSYLTRKNFGAVISEYVVAEGVTKSSASIVTVALFICYGLGQLFSGWLGDRVKPKYVIFAGLAATSALNLAAIAVGSNTVLLTVVWGLNGFAQAMLWPPMVRITSDYLTSEDYQTACVRITWGGSIGTIAVYLVSSLFIKLFASWRTVFVFSAVCGILMTVLWMLGMSRVERFAGAESSPAEASDAPEPADAEPRKKPKVNLFAVSPLLLIMLAIVFQGMLRDGVETWMPSYLHDTFGLDTSSSILTSVGLPIFSIFSIQVASVVYRKWFRNEMTCSTVIFGVGFVCAVLLGVFCGANVALSALLVVLITGAMHGVNLIMTCMVAAAYGKYGNVSFVSGLLNSCTYIGSALFTYGIARLADLFDWRATIFSWAGVALLGIICCAAAIRSWARFKAK